MNSLSKALICIRLGDITSRLDVLLEMVVGNMNEEDEVVFKSLLSAISCSVDAMKILCADSETP